MRLLQDRTDVAVPNEHCIGYYGLKKESSPLHETAGRSKAVRAPQKKPQAEGKQDNEKADEEVPHSGLEKVLARVRNEKKAGKADEAEGKAPDLEDGKHECGKYVRHV